MNVLFIHQNFPGQYLHLAQYVNSLGGHNIVGIGEADNIKNRGTIHGITTFGYPKPKGAGTTTHHYLQNTEAEVRRGQNVVRSLIALKHKGFNPDVICVHPGWGEGFFIREVFPDKPILMFCEFFFRAKQADLAFDPEFPRSSDWDFSVCVRNAGQLVSLSSASLCHSPTIWQVSRYPAWVREHIEIVHDGIDTQYMQPKSDPYLVLQRLNNNGDSKVIKVNDQCLGKNEAQIADHVNGAEQVVLGKKNKIITYVARNLEPYRGFHIFMRTLPFIQEKHPDAEILIVGGDNSSYSPLPVGSDETYKKRYLTEMQGRINLDKIHFLGKVPYMALREIFCLTKAHVYLTYPFVLSWSVLEAMSCEALVIGSDTEPVREVITHGQNGLLVDFFKIEEIAEAVSHALSNPEDFMEIRKNARKSVKEKYDLPKCLKAQASLLNDLFHGKYPVIS